MTAAAAHRPPCAPGPGVLPDATIAGATDKQLLEQFAAGEQDAFGELVRRHEQPAYRVALRILDNEADARDAVQDSFMIVLKKHQSFNGQAAFRTWLVSVVTNAALALRRRQGQFPARECGKRSAEKEYARTHREKQTRTPPDMLAEQELSGVIGRILKDHATPRGAKVYILSAQGWTYEEIAEMVGLSPPMVGQEKMKVVRILREKLTELGWLAF